MTNLVERKLQIRKYLNQNYSNKEIAEKLQISHHSVKALIKVILNEGKRN